jgi:LCP family protein required for cell wall assembly
MTKKSAAVAALLSFIFPGLGHAYLGRRREALVFAVPAVVVAVAIGVEAVGGPEGLIAFLITPSGAMTALALMLVTGGWRLIAMIDAVLTVRRKQGLSARALLVPVILGVVLVAGHGAAGYVAYGVYDASSRIFVAAGPDDNSATPGTTDGGSPGTTPGGVVPGTDDPSGGPTPVETDEYNVAPLATPATVQDRINILLTGIDSAEQRTTSLTDTIMVVSVDPEDGSVVMLSIPRDISQFPTYDGRTFKGKINSFMTWVRNHPGDYPDKPFPALMKQVGYLVGVPIHYFAAIDLQGFRKMINAVGGVTVNNPKPINDPAYDWLDGTYGFTLPAGKVQLNGRTALAYARSRQGEGDTDFTRAARQQQLLVALRNKLTSADMLTKLPDIISVAGDTVRTNLPSGRFEEFIKLAREVDPEAIQREVLTYPYAYHPPTASTGGVWTLQLRMKRVAELSRKLFGDDSRYAAD